MKVSDFIVDYLIQLGVNDVFGYPGGMVTHLMDSLYKRKDEIKTHLSYHEQGAAFSACGYAQAGRKIGVAFATSGPGATNLVTGICNAYFDSIPVLFITGQVNTYESKGSRNLRQCGFQETDIISMVGKVTKYAASVDTPNRIRWYMDKAIYEATQGRKGGVLLDIPMNILRSEIDEKDMIPYIPYRAGLTSPSIAVKAIMDELGQSHFPVFLFGNGVKSAQANLLARELIVLYGIPAVTSMIAVDVLGESEYNFGFIGAYGSRAANFVVAKADLLVSFASRLDIRQVGKNRKGFAPDAKIIRVDIDQNELAYKVHEDELCICCDVSDLLKNLCDIGVNKVFRNRFKNWVNICQFIRFELCGRDDGMPNHCLRYLFSAIPDNALICADVGQNQVWVAQAVSCEGTKRLLFSGSNGAMGYALPAAIGAQIALNETVYAICGDGGIQMNIQELQVVARENIPVKIVILNNNSLGMIRHFQEMYFEKNYFLTVDGAGYANPDFQKIADGYGISHKKIYAKDLVGEILFTKDGAELIEVVFDEDTYVFPKLEYGKPNQDQEPLLEREEYEFLMDNDRIIKEIHKLKHD